MKLADPRKGRKKVGGKAKKNGFKHGRRTPRSRRGGEICRWGKEHAVAHSGGKRREKKSWVPKSRGIYDAEEGGRFSLGEDEVKTKEIHKRGLSLIIDLKRSRMLKRNVKRYPL